MSVRDAILGILTLGPTYGHQILFEIHTRLPHRSSVNPGQVYATLTRLATNGLVERAGVTSSHLPLYQLSPAGLDHAASWLIGDGETDVSDWTEVLDVVLLASTLPTINVEKTCHGILQHVTTWAESTADASQTSSMLFLASRKLHAAAVSSWLDTVVSDECSPHHRKWGLSQERPSRGRRPNSVK